MGALGAPSLHDSGFGGFVSPIYNGLAVIGIWGSSGCPLGNVDGTATANFVGTIPWLPSDIPPGASLCDT